MRPFERRIWVTAVLMCLCYFGTLWVRKGYTFEVVPLSRTLDSTPLELDGWRGVDRPLDDRVEEILNAQARLNRVYRDRDGVVVTLNVSAWLRPETVSEVAPHVPKICYTNAGWKILEEREVPVSTSNGDLPLVTLLLERQGERVVVGYWYQMGNSHFNSANEARRIHRGLWGKPRWPATVKVLLQTTAVSIEAGLLPIERFALLIHHQLSEVPDEVHEAE